MKIKIHLATIAFFAIMLVSSCSKSTNCEDCMFDCIDDFSSEVFTNDCAANYDCEFELILNKSFDKSSELYLMDSDSTDIIYHTSYTEGSLSIIDDEVHFAFYFEVAKSWNEFNFSDSDLYHLNPRVFRTCECPMVAGEAIEIGCMQGEKQDGIWFIQASLEVPYFDGMYELDFKL